MKLKVWIKYLKKKIKNRGMYKKYKMITIKFYRVLGHDAEISCSFMNTVENVDRVEMLGMYMPNHSTYACYAYIMADEDYFMMYFKEVLRVCGNRIKSYTFYI